MMGELFGQAVREARRGSLIAAGVTALVIAPSFTIIGGLLTLFLLVSAYPLFLIGCYWMLGWRAALRLTARAAPPRWRSGLAIGGGVTLRLTLTLLITAVAMALAFGGLFTAISLLDNHPDPNGEGPFQFLGIVLGLVRYFIPAYLAGAVVLGLPCAWFSAWLALREGPFPVEDARASDDQPSTA